MAEPAHSIGDALDVFFPGNICHDLHGFAASFGDLAHEFRECRFAAGGEHQARALQGGHSSGDKADATGCTGDDHDLFR